MLGVRRARRDRRIALCRVEPLIGDRRIVVEVDQIMRNAGMVRLALEDRLEDRRALELLGVGLVARRGRNVEGDRVVDLRLVVVGIFRRQRLHRLEISLHARPILDLVVVGIEHGERVDVVALALALGADRLGLLDRRERRREIRRRRREMRVVPQTQRNAPIGDGARGIRLERILEDVARGLVPERMLVAHGAVEAPLRRLVARGGEMHHAELLVRFLLRDGGRAGKPEGGSGCDDGRERRCTHGGLRARDDVFRE